MTKKAPKISRFMKVCLAFSISMLLVASGMFLLTQLLESEVSSSEGPGPMGNETLPDLSISPADIFFLGGPPVEGDIVFIIASVHNIGGSAADNVTVEFWDDACEGCPALYLIGTDYIPEIKPGHVGNASAAWDTSGQPGLSMITVIVDPYDYILESDEGNNVASKSIYVQPKDSDDMPPMINKVLVDGEPLVIVDAGTLVEVTAEIDDSLTGLSLISSANYTIGQANWPTATPMDPTDGVFDEPFELVESTIDTKGWLDGLYEVWVYGCDVVPNCNTTGSYAVIMIIPGNITGPDLTIGEFYRPSKIDPGQTVHMWANVHNIGDQDAYNVTVRFVDWFESNGTLIGDAFLNYIPAGSAGNASVNWIAGPFGLHIIEINADPDNLIPEIDEGNNVAYYDVFVGEIVGPDLEICGIFFSDDTPEEGQIIDIRACIFNGGNRHAYNVTVEFTDWVGGMPPGLPIGRALIPIIKVGYAGNATVKWLATPPGMHWINVVADPDDVIPELDELNNIGTRPILVGGTSGIDLAISPSGIHFDDDTPEEGQLVNMWVYFANIGTQDAYNVTVEIVDWFEGIPVPIDEVNVYYVPAGKDVTVFTTWLAVPSGDHKIEVTLDPDNWIPEDDESNNVASRSITVGPSGGEIYLFVKATTFDNDNDGRYDDVVILVFNSDEKAVEGASVFIDGIFYGMTADTGLLVLLNFSLGYHQVEAVFGPHSAKTTFYSEG